MPLPSPTSGKGPTLKPDTIAPHTQAPRLAANPWYAVFVLTVCYTLSFIDRQILGLLVGPIKADLRISDTQVGLLGGFAFSIFYTVMGLPIGRLVDRYNRRNIVAVGVVLWSIMTAACAFTRSFGALFIMRMGVGVGEAALNPSAVSMIADSFRKERLGAALGVYSMGVYIGSGLALLVGGLVVEAIAGTPTIVLPLVGEVASWRATFLLVGVPGVLVSLWVLTLKEPARSNALARDDGSQAALTIRETVAELTQRWRSVLGISGGLMMQAAALYAFMLWSAVVLQRVYGWAAGDTGLVMGCLVITGGCLGMFTGGWVADRWLQAGHRDGSLRVAMFSAGAGCAIFTVLLLTLGSVAATLACFFFGVIVLAMPTGCSYAASQMILPNQVRGQGVAFILLVANLGGLSIGPLLPGVLNDYVFFSEAAIGRSLAITLALSTGAAALIFAWARPAYRADHAKLHP